MYAFALTAIGLALGAQPVELPHDVSEIQTRQFGMPLRVDPNQQAAIKQVRLFVSVDRGKHWKHEKDCEPTETLIPFSAERDGLYWFALRVEFRDGKSVPPVVDELIPAMKVYVNTKRESLKPKKTYEELQREVEDLRKTVQRLQAKVKGLEAERNPN